MGLENLIKDKDYTALIPAYDRSAKELVETFIKDEEEINCD
jgi:hypothetical protein